VKYCRASAFRKMIVRIPGKPDLDLCTSPEHVNCPAAQADPDALAGGVHCPGLQEALMQYCAAASLTKYIPYSEAVLSHCGTDSHKYCELFLTFAHPERRQTAGIEASTQEADTTAQEYLVEGIRVPGWLAYSANHLWIDTGTDGVVHIGIDAFLASVLDTIDRITFVTTHGTDRPTVVFTVHDVDFQVMFPHPIHLTSCNLYLRTHPSTILSDPYTLGWLFEGRIDGDVPATQTLKGLVSGRAAADWMQTEITRMSAMAHTFSHAQGPEGLVVMADGGMVHPGFMQFLTRDESLRVFNEFFSPLAGWRQSP
jgi:glycine cleavage system H lipoate-binding protein